MKLLEGKVAVVTGAARGIGKAIALEFAKEGADVAFTDLTIDENGKATEAEIAALGVRAKGYASNAANFEDTHKVIDQIMQDFGSNCLCCTPSYALYLADTAISMGYDPAKDFKLSAGIFGAEPASENMRQEIRDKLGIRYCDVYGLSEVMGPGVAMECSESHGLHLAEDHFFAEIIDPETLQPVPDGTYGELVFTTLTRECCPLVRYRTRDITRIINEECTCGRTHRKIDRIIGRSDDMMIIRGVNVFPQQIEQIITGFDEITAHYQIVLTDNGPLDKVTLNVETVPEFPIDEIRKLEDLKARLGAELKSNLQIKVDIKIVEPKSIERSEGKAKRVIDLREGKH